MKLASIETVVAVSAHPNADSLDLAQVLGWQCVVKRGQFKSGDRVVFIPIDTILPDSAPWASFLKKGDRLIRVKTIKLRGQVSRGLVFSTDILPAEMRNGQIGLDVGVALGVKKFEKEVPMNAGDMLGAFPQWLVSKTDEDNGLSYPEIVDEVLKHPVTVTLKLDGSSCTVVVADGVITKVCSRNVDLAESDSSIFWMAAKKLTIPEGFSAVIQGELMGPGIQGNQLGLSEPELYVYQVRRDIIGVGRPEWVDYESMSRTCAMIGARVVPCLYHKVACVKAELERLASDVLLPNQLPAEGIVVRPSDYRMSGTGRPLGFKLINPNYKED